MAATGFMHRRLPPTISGAPAIDNLFTQIWWGLATLQLWGFLYLITLLTLREGALITTIVFGGLLFLFLFGLAVILGLPMARRSG